MRFALPATGLFTPIFVPDAMHDAVGDRAFLQAMLDAEAALALAESAAGVIPAEAAQAIAGAADRADEFDLDAIGREARAAGNPVPALVRALEGVVGGDAARYVHWGATSQDIVDTASMLVARQAIDLIRDDLDAVADACAALADRHRATPMAGRTLLQQALPVTFGLKAAGWLSGVTDAWSALTAISTQRLALQLGGAAGTLASLGDSGPAVMRNLAEELDLVEPPLPWHTSRARVAELGCALAIAAGTLAKIALDVELLAQTEVGEAVEPAGDGRGGSSTLPHKRNPIGSVVIRACAMRVQAAAGVLVAALPQEHERAAGAWHAEWEPLREALALTGGAAAAARELVEGLEVNPERMRANLAATDGLVMAESAMLALAAQIGRPAAMDVLKQASARAAATGRSLRDELAATDAVTEHMTVDEIDAALDPAAYLGSAEAFVDRAIDAYRRHR
jgi:3-carboxy-cis,cis-muconate cycloisomerase